MSSDKTTMSASMPGAMVPLRCSSKDAHAGPEVYASIALFNDSRAAVLCIGAGCRRQTALSPRSGLSDAAGHPLPNASR